MKELEMADITLVEIRGTPHCKLHGAMNKVSKNGVWRCIGVIGKSDCECRAGCVIEESK